MSKDIRIIEITCCGECPHLDARTESPWWCGGLGDSVIMDTNKIHKDCPLDTKKEYLSSPEEI